jgi:hypothetical protein
VIHILDDTSSTIFALGTLEFRLENLKGNGLAFVEVRSYDSFLTPVVTGKSSIEFLIISKSQNGVLDVGPINDRVD